MEDALVALQGASSLEDLELIIPWDHIIMNCDLVGKEILCPCPGGREALQSLSPRELILHAVENDVTDPGRPYWDRLSRLGQRSGLTISLVLHHGKKNSKWHQRTGLSPWNRRLVQKCMRQGRWLKAYAEVMGYRFGHTC